MANKLTYWTEDMDDELLFMDFIGATASYMAEQLSIDFGRVFTRDACIGRRWRIAKNGKKYNYNEKDFE